MTVKINFLNKIWAEFSIEVVVKFINGQISWSLYRRISFNILNSDFCYFVIPLSISIILLKLFSLKKKCKIGANFSPNHFFHYSGPPFLPISDLWMCGMTPPPAIVALMRLSNSSSPRMASCKWRGVIRFTFKSFEALPANSNTYENKSIFLKFGMNHLMQKNIHKILHIMPQTTLKKFYIL